MKTANVFLMFMLFFVSGCSKPSYYWYHPNKTLEQARRDYSDSRRQARTEAGEAVAEECFDYARSSSRPSSSYSTPREGGMLEDNPHDAWQSWGETYEHNVFAGCMKERGYEKVKAHRLPADVRTKSLPLGAIAGR
jgi:hypothetical protein